MKIHRDVISGATDAQLKALRDNVLNHWQHIPDDGITIVREIAGDAIMVFLKAPDQAAAFTIGIEPDGYTHS